jgi:hypothetical protein
MLLAAAPAVAAVVVTDRPKKTEIKKQPYGCFLFFPFFLSTP